MRAEDIVDHETFRAWLKEHEPEQGVAVWLDSRAALRVLPLAWYYEGRTKKISWLRNSVLRCINFSDVVSLRSASGRVKAAADVYGASDTFVAAGADAIALGNAHAASDAFAAGAAYAAAAYVRSSAIFVAAHAYPTAAVAYSEIAADCADIERDEARVDAALWRVGTSPFAETWAQIAQTERGRAATSGDETARGRAGLDWTFWVDWYEDVLAGRPRNIPMMEDIALEVDWDKEPADVLSQINGIREKYQDEKPRARVQSAKQLAEVKLETSVLITALKANRKALPPTFDALEELIGLEIQRVQRDNWLNAHNPEEAERLIKTFCTLYDCVWALRNKTAVLEDIDDDATEEIESLLELYKSKIQALPREKADEIVEGVYNFGKGSVQVGLILGTTALFSYFALPALGGAIAGSVGFGLKGAADIVKAARKDKGDATD